MARGDGSELTPIALVGDGPTGTVVQARDTATGVVVAVRYLSGELLDLPGFLAALRQDVSRLAGLDHANVARVYELIEDEPVAALVTELVDGPSLRDVLRSGGVLEPVAAVYVVGAVFAGLGALHARGVVHGAVRPSNIRIDRDGAVKIVDAGLILPPEVGAAAGPYVAPEVRAGGRPAVRADIFAVAAVLFECLTGQAPWSTVDDPTDMSGEPGFDPTSGPWPDDAPYVLRAFVASGLVSQIGARPSDARAAADQLALSAVRLYGPDWYELGRAALSRRVSELPVGPAPASSRASLDALPAVSGISRVRPAWAELLTYGHAAEQTASAPRAAAPDSTAGSAPAQRRHPARRRLTRVMIVASVLVVLGAVIAFAIAAAHPPVTASAADALVTNVHQTVAVPEPTVPNPAAAPAGGDTTGPATPAGVHLTGRAVTAISIDWADATDDTGVAGYIALRDGKRIGTSLTPGFTYTGLTARTTYHLEVQAFDATGNVSPPSAAITVTTLDEPDVSPPTVPTGLHPTGKSATSVVLAWNRSRDNVGIAGYEVYRDGALIANVTRPGFTDTKLAPASTHTYRIRAFDTSDNASADSAPTTVTTLSTADTIAPSTPGHVIAQSTGSTTIGVSWNPSNDNVGVTGYEVLRDGSLVAQVAAPAFTDQGLTPDTVYHYAVRALDAAGNASGLSATAAATTGPDPTTPPPTTAPTTGPSASIVAVDLVATIDNCVVTVQATVTATGPMDITLYYTITGTAGGSVDLSFTSTTLTQAFDLPQTGPATEDGSATAVAGSTAAAPVNWSATCSTSPSAT